MKFKKHEINSLEDLVVLFEKVDNCPSNEKELIRLLNGMKKAGFVDNIIDAAYYVRAFIASHDQTLQYGPEEQLRQARQKEENPYKVKIELVHNYIKKEENWQKPETPKTPEQETISLGELIAKMNEMNEEERDAILSQLPEEILEDIKDAIESINADDEE